jgi:hypothetical protein
MDAITCRTRHIISVIKYLLVETSSWSHGKMHKHTHYMARGYFFENKCFRYKIPTYVSNSENEFAATIVVKLKVFLEDYRKS